MSKRKDGVNTDPKVVRQCPEIIFYLYLKPEFYLLRIRILRQTRKENGHDCFPLLSYVLESAC